MISSHTTLKWLAIVAITFGLVTIISGGQALFGSLEARAAVGQAVPFVLWFNFLAGFLYLVAGAGLLWRRRWAVYISIFVAISTLFVFGAFGLHVILGRAHELRTVGAMSLRTLFWVALAIFAIRTIKKAPECGPRSD